MKQGRVLLVLCLTIWFVQPCLGKEADSDALRISGGEGPIEIEAERLIYERDPNRYEAHGQVRIARGDLSLQSDHAQLDMVTKDMMAWGNVTLREGEDVLECERLELNLDTRLGKIYQARFFLKEQNFRVSGEEAEKLGENRYRIRNGSFTTCDAKRPPWKFSAKELDMTVEGFGIVKESVFYVQDVPALYLPAGIFPVKRERQSGFLIPKVGYSNKHGMEAKGSFFWALRKDMDATLSLEYLGDRGFKEGLEYRYALTRETKGQANVYFIDDQVYDDNRYAFF